MNVTLIGMAGVGKSLIGSRLAEQLDYLFIDTDTLIEADQQRTLSQIIHAEGEAAFCRIEEAIVCGLAVTDKSVIAPGGSIVYSDAAM